MAIFQNAERDAADLAKLVNEDTDVTTRYGTNPKKSAPKAIREIGEAGDAAINNFNDDGDAAINAKKADFDSAIASKENEFDLTLEQYKESRGFNTKGTFADGFTYELPNDVGLDADGNPWIYNGTLPFTVTAGTAPTSPNYTQVAYGTAAQVSTNTSDTVQTFVDSFALKIFQSPADGGLTEIQTRTVNANEVYEVRKTSDDSLATIYSDKEGDVEIVQNGTANKSDSGGVVEFYIADGDYYVEVDAVQSKFKAKKLEPFKTVAEMKSYDLSGLLEGTRVEWQGYYEQSDGGGNWGVLKFGAHTDDGGSIFSIDAGTYVEANLKGKTISVRKFGAVGDGITDSTAAIQSMIDTLGYFNLTNGVFIISDTLKIRSNSSTGYTFSGEGMEKSVIRAVGMTGKAMIETENNPYIRVVMSDFKMDGEADTCLNFNSTLELYQSSFSNMYLISQDTCFYILNQFSTNFHNVHVSSTNGHGFEVEGGNSTLFTGCYAHAVGEGKAGYRVLGRCTMIACNGIDEHENNSWWGWFGNNPSQSYQVTLIGCNIEDFGESGALNFENFGWFKMDNTSFVPRSTGTYLTLIRTDNSANQTMDIGIGCTSTTKGAVRTGASNIYSRNLNVSSKSKGFDSYRDESISLTYSTPFISTEPTTYGSRGLSISQLIAGIDYSYMRPIVKTLPDGASTYSISESNAVKTANSTATTLNNLTDGEDGQKVTLLIKDSLTTIKDSFAAAGRFKLKSGADELASNGDVYTFIVNGDNLVQV